MTQNGIKTFAMWMGILGTAFGGKGLTKSQMDIYFEFLSDLDIEVMAKAARKIIETRKYPTFPTVAEIREAALGSDAEVEDEALAAWSIATRLVSAGLRPKDDRLDEAIKLAFGSWDRFGQTDPAMEAADRNHFIRCFKAIDRRRRQAKELPGPAPTKRLTEGGNHEPV